MNILSLCTALPTALLSLQKGETFFYAEVDSSTKHSENLLVNVEKLLTEANLRLSDIDVLALVKGPGSFTGLRIAAATAKAILLTNKNMKAVSIGTLEFLAQGSACVAVLSALSGRFFAAEYDQDGNEIWEPTLLTKEELIEKAKGKTIISCEEIYFDNIQKTTLSADNLAKLVEKYVKNGIFCSENELTPLYLRKSQAEENLKENFND